MEHLFDFSVMYSFRDDSAQSIKINKIVTFVHIFCLLTVALLLVLMMVLHFLTKDMKNYYTAETFLFFQLGLLDIFVGFMIWFLMDDDA